ncbi:MAG: tryptophan synthase subunit alpha [Solirubrobacterales bacterium]
MAEPGSERIAAAFEAARGEGRAALMPYMVGGYPDHETSLAVAEAYVEGGADLIELGVPFSDPLADGPLIHAAATDALAAGATLDSVLEVCATVSDCVPVLLMIYSNMVLARGPQRFAAAAKAAGAAGAIVPDLSFEESPGIRDVLTAEGLALVPLVAPTTPDDRRRRICESASGFVYVVSLVGVTGERGKLPADLAEFVSAVRDEAPVPAAVGFGIGSAAQAAGVGEIADGVIIGSRLVREVGEASDGEAPSAARDFIASCRETMG